MNGDPARLESTDSGGTSDPRKQRGDDPPRRDKAFWRETAEAFRLFGALAEEVGEWKLSREAEDAAARATGEGQRCSESVHGEDTPQAEMKL